MATLHVDEREAGMILGIMVNHFVQQGGFSTVKTALLERLINETIEAIVVAEKETEHSQRFRKLTPEEASTLLSERELQFIEEHCLIDAVKSARARLNLGLREAKDLVWRAMGRVT